MGRLRFELRTNRLKADRFHPFFKAMTGVSFKSLLKCLLDLEIHQPKPSDADMDSSSRQAAKPVGTTLTSTDH